MIPDFINHRQPRKRNQETVDSSLPVRFAPDFISLEEGCQKIRRAAPFPLTPQYFQEVFPSAMLPKQQSEIRERPIDRNNMVAGGSASDEPPRRNPHNPYQRPQTVPTFPIRASSHHTGSNYTTKDRPSGHRYAQHTAPLQRETPSCCDHPA